MNRRAKAKYDRVGSLRGSLLDIASEVIRKLVDGPKLVWVEDDASVYCGPPSEAEWIPPSWIAGIYTLGHLRADIEADLRALLRERSKDWIIDSGSVE